MYKRTYRLLIFKFGSSDHGWVQLLGHLHRLIFHLDRVDDSHCDCEKVGVDGLPELESVARRWMVDVGCSNVP